MSNVIDIRKLVRGFEKSVILYSTDPCEQTENNLDQARNKLLTAVKSLETPAIELSVLKRYADSMTATVEELRKRNHTLENQIAAKENVKGLSLAQ